MIVKKGVVAVINYSSKERFLEPSPRGPFGLSALFRFLLLLDFFGFPRGTRVTYCVVGGGWWVGRIFERY